MCVFCLLVQRYDEDPATAPAVVDEWPDVLALAPVDPVTTGHLLVIPKRHVTTAADDPEVTGRVSACAAELAAGLPHFNLIANAGAEATQTVPHLHLHLVPRYRGDGLLLPWSLQQKGRIPELGRA